MNNTLATYCGVGTEYELMITGEGNLRLVCDSGPSSTIVKELPYSNANQKALALLMVERVMAEVEAECK